MGLQCPHQADATFGPTVSGCRDDFDFTIFFEDTFFAIIPSAVLLLAAPFQLLALSRQRPIVLRGRLLSCKLVLTIAFLAVQVASLVDLASQPQRPLSTTTGAAIISVISGCVICVLSYYSHIRSPTPSTLLQIYLGMSLLLDVPRLRTSWLQVPQGFSSIMATVSVGIKMLLCFVEAMGKRGLLRAGFNFRGAEAMIGLFNRSLFWWLNGILLTGHKRPLQTQDIYDIDEELGSPMVYAQLKEKLNTSIAQAKDGILISTMVAYRWSLFRAILPRLFLIGFKYSQPFLIDALIGLISKDRTQMSINKGRGLIAAYILVYAGIAVAQGRYWHRTYRTITMVRGGLICAILEKSLKLGTADNRNDAAFTLISTDVERICQSLRNMHELWANVIELSIAIYLLTRQLGGACIAPIVVSAACAISSLALSSRVEDSQKIWLSGLHDRLAVTSSVLGNIRGVKLLGLAGKTIADLCHLRKVELKLSIEFRTLLTWVVGLSEANKTLAPSAAFLCFSIISLVDGSTSILTNRAFTSLAVLALLGEPLHSLIQALPNLIAGVACFRRIQAFLILTEHLETRETMDQAGWASDFDHSILNIDDVELQTLQRPHALTLQPTVALSAVTVSNVPENRPILKNISLTARPSQILAITGPVGSGKTALLQVLLGELRATSGTVATRARYMAFCAQTTWLQSGSLREQILFGEVFHEEWYAEVIRACALVDDIDWLPLGDATEVGGKGDKLSGGQKQRVAIARAVYSKARVMIFDDVFSALDKITTQHVFTNIFGSGGLLRQSGTTIVLVSQSSLALRHANHIIVLDSRGHLAHQGSWETLRKVSGHVQLLAEVAHQDDDTVRSKGADNLALKPNAQGLREPQFTAIRTPNEEIVAEHRGKGDLGLYKTYAKAVGKRLTTWILLLFAVSAFSTNFSTLLLKWWASANAESPNKDIAKYLTLYCVLAVMALTSLTFACWLTLCVMTPKAGNVFHLSVATTTIRARFSFLANTRIGELTNRFTQDMQLIDTQLPIAGLNTFEALADVIAQIAVICSSASYTAIAIPFCIVCVYYVQQFYLLTSRQLRLIEIEAKSPLYSHILSIPEGLVTIRAFNAEQRILEQGIRLLDRSQRPYYLLLCIQRWLTFVLDCLIGALATLIVVIAVEIPGSIPEGSAGVALVTVLNCNQTLANLITSWTMMETSLGAVGRVQSFERDTPTEDSEHRTPLPLAQWPHYGSVDINNVVCAWTDDAEPVLKNISLTVQPGEHVGICGRTGSGKSSLLLALFQMIPMRSGTIHIDGLDISTMEPDALRSSLNAMPQEPLIFPNDSLRSNLCLGKLINDETLRSALESIGLWSQVAAKSGLDTLASDMGFSHGQSQIFCFARALISESKIVVLDEATASCDAEANTRIQNLLHTSLRDRTVITVEHRLENLLRCDKLAVLDQGRLCEYESPGALLEIPGSAFKRLCEDASGNGGLENHRTGG